MVATVPMIDQTTAGPEPLERSAFCPQPGTLVGEVEVPFVYANRIPHSARGEIAIDGEREIDPARRVWIELDPPLYAADDELELAVVDAIHDDRAGVGALSRRPLAQHAGKVADVLGDDDAVFLGCKGEDIFVLNALERRILVECAHIVAILPQRATDVGTRDVRVE
jgi:hypothetical protein